MKLFVNGCSFTHGHKDWGKSMLATDWVWPSLMSDRFDETVNLAWPSKTDQLLLQVEILLGNYLHICNVSTKFINVDPNNN